MALHVALTSPELTALLAGPHTVKTYLYAIKGTATATAVVDGTPASFPLGSITVKSVSGNWSSVAAGMTVQIGNKGLYRVRATGNSTTLNLMELSNGEAGLVPIAIRTAGIADGDAITVYLDRHDIWAVVPRIDYPGSGTTANIYEDYSATVGASNTTPGPIVNMGENLLLFVDAGQTYATWTWTTAAPYWPSASSISSYAYTVDASWTVTGGSIATATFTAQIPVGEYSLYCTVTDGAGGVSTGVRNVVVQNRSGANSPIPIVSYSDTWDRLGWTATLDINDSQLANIADGACVIVKQEATFNGSTSVTAAQTFVGWVIRQTETSEPGLRSATLEIVGPAGLMAKLPGYSQYFELAVSPSIWQEIASGLNYVDFLVRWMVEHRAKNLVELFDWTRMGISNLSGRSNVWKIQGQTLLAQVQDLVQAYNANFGCNPNGEFMVRQHPSLLDTTARNAIVERGTITASIAAKASPAREMRHNLRFLWGEGFYYDGTTVVPVKSVAPGNAPSQGVGEEKLDRQLVDSQADLDYRTEREYQRRNNPYADIPLDIPGNWGALIYPAEMAWLRVNIAAAYRPTNAAFNNRTVPLRIRRTFSEGGVVDTQLETEGETDSVQGQPVPIPVGAAAALFGSYSGQSFVQPPATWGAANTNTPISPRGVLMMTADCHVVRGTTWALLSPSGVQRLAMGTGIKLLANALNYKQLIAFASQGAAICTDATVSNPPWTLLNLGSGSGGGWSHTIDFTVSNGSFTATSQSDGFTPDAPGAYGGGTGWQTQVRTASGPTRTATECDVDITLPSSHVTSVVMTFDSALGTFNAGTIFDTIQLYNGASLVGSQGVDASTQSGTGLTLTFTGDVTATQIRLLLKCSFYTGTHSDGSGTIKSLVINGTDGNPFGGSGGGSATNEVFIADMVSSINRQGYYGWLSVKTVSAVQYVHYNWTFNSFGTRFSTQVAHYDAALNYGIQLGSYSSGSTGLVYVTAGAPGSSDANAYKSTNWGSSFSATADTLAVSGGIIAVGYTKRGGASNTGTSPEYVLVLNNTTNLTARGADASSHTVVAGTGSVPHGQQSLTSYTLDFNYLYFITKNGNVYTTSNGATAWSAGTAITGGASFIARGINGWPSNKAFALAWGYRALIYTTNAASSWTSLWASFDTFRASNSVSETIVTALGDLSQQYSRPITQ